MWVVKKEKDDVQRKSVRGDVQRKGVKVEEENVEKLVNNIILIINI